MIGSDERLRAWHIDLMMYCTIAPLGTECTLLSPELRGSYYFGRNGLSKVHCSFWKTKPLLARFRAMPTFCIGKASSSQQARAPSIGARQLSIPPNSSPSNHKSPTQLSRLRNLVLHMANIHPPLTVLPSCPPVPLESRNHLRREPACTIIQPSPNTALH